MWIFLFLLIFLFWFIIIPLFKAIMMMNRLKNNVSDMFNRATGRQQRSSSNDNESATRRSRKKIDASVGEYVEFEEIEVSVSQTQSSGDSVSYKIESQVVDVEWEDIK